MARWGMVAAATAVAAGAAFVTGAVVPPRGTPAGGKAEIKVAATVAGRVGYFNQARVMREYKRANQNVAKLNARRERMARNIMSLRAMYLDLQKAAQAATAPAAKEQVAREMLTVMRLVEDGDREITKALNERASGVIVELFQEIRATVREVARENGLSAVHAFPGDPNTTNPMEMELMLRPQAMQPYYLDASADFTDELVRRLNEKFDDDE